jgi:outer membrane protein OmpA-like peptidoglycan-associated protein
MTRSMGPLASAGLVLAVFLFSEQALAQKYMADDPVPEGSKGVVLPLNGVIVPLRAVVLEIRGVAGAVSGRIDPLQAALKDLGATVRGKEIKIALNADVLFDFDKAELRPNARPELEKVAAVLKSYPNAAVTIEGHTDGKGNDQYNQKLSERRAESIRGWLLANGVKTKMTARGFGRTKPVAPNVRQDGSDDPAGRQKNRRVEITVRT